MVPPATVRPDASDDPRGPSATRTLVVMRHAKAERQGATDFERTLSDRGHLDAADAGAWLAARGVAPQAALVSAARRTEQTWEAVAAAAGWSLEPELDRALYLADEEVVLEAVRRVAPTVGTLVVLGHNPTMHALAVWLDDGDGDPAARATIASAYPTSATCVLDVTGDWADLAGGRATVRALHVGRG
ncbi:histidine phosphatase family protein [Nocardioides lentus]|uniref:Histidine phosphatase family protein n=1 Tax=Nocardioides lentus TaxID=338077 RepID=A0ABN2P4U4_9ACTN